MAQFNGKIPPPWQTRPQAPQLQNSLLGQHPASAGPMTNQQIVIGAAPQAAQYAPVQQSIIPHPGLGGLQTIPQTHIAQHNIPQPSANLVQGQPTITQVSLPQPSIPACQVSSNLLAQSTVTPNIPAANLVTHPQLVQSQMQQIQSQVATVAYPAPRALAPPVSFNSQVTQISHAGNIVSNIPGSGMVPAVPPGAANNVGSTSSAQQPQKQRVFTGTVTKLCADFGFVDEDVFFQTSCVKGTTAKVGDRVLVEASYNPNMPFKWNANRVQVIPGPINTSSNQSNRNASLRESSRNLSFNVAPPPTFSNDNNSSSTFANRASLVPRSRSPRRDRREDNKRLARERLDREDKEKDVKRESRKRSRSRDRSRSPVRRRTRVVPRYNVQVPKIMLHMKEANVLELRKRYSNLYVPSDVFLARPLWSETFPAHRSFQFPRSVSFHIMSKEVDPMFENDAVYDPPDVNHSYAAKVMLMAVPPLEDIYRRSCALSEDPTDVKSCFVHPTRLINFLVGLKGKNETMAIGGYWSPSYDGASPDKDPNVLIKTAIRTCKALTGIDLSRCTTWYRFAEIFYRRGECTHKGRLIPARLETTVIFLPDVWNICPTKLEWDGLLSSYRKQLDLRLRPPVSSSSSALPSSSSTGGGGAEGSNEGTSSVGAGDTSEEKDPASKDPTHWANLDPKTMKVLELRNELDARNMNSKGLKSQLIARLTKTVKAEQEKEEQEKTQMEKTLSNEESKKREDEERRREEEKRRKEEDRRKEEEEKKKAEEREKSLMEKRYTLPEQPMIIVHPSRSAKSGKFDCTTMSLSVLLDYRQEDNKEHSFEVSLFAELFNEMLMRDFAFKIFTSLVEAPDKTKDDKKEKERDKEKKNEREEERDDKDEKKDDNNKSDNNKKIDNKSESKDDKEIKKEDFQEDEEYMEDEYEEEIEEEETKEMNTKPGSLATDKDKDKDTTRGDKDKKKDDRKDSRDSGGRREKKEKRKMATVNPHLLLSFVYFDQTHTGYILDKDLEDIINILGLNFSRAQLKKLMSKVISRDALYYRKLTDVSAEEKLKYKEVVSLLDCETLAKGNNDLLPLFGDVTNSDKVSKRVSRSSKDEPIVTSSGVVKYEGSLVDIGKLMQQLERSEKARCDTEERLKELQRELCSSKDDSKKLFEKSQKLSKELKSLQSTCKTTEEELKKALEDNGIYHRALHQVSSVIRPLVSIDGPEEVDLPREDIKIKVESSENGFVGL